MQKMNLGAVILSKAGGVFDSSIRCWKEINRTKDFLDLDHGMGGHQQMDPALIAERPASARLVGYWTCTKSVLGKILNTQHSQTCKTVLRKA